MEGVSNISLPFKYDQSSGLITIIHLSQNNIVKYLVDLE